MKKRLISAGSILMALCILTMNICAAAAVELGRKGSISIQMTYQEEIVPGGSLTLYRVAEVYQNSGGYGFRYVEPYRGCQVSLTDIASPKTARDLADYTDASSFEGVVGEIDAQGRVSFEDLELGLYLLVQEEAAEGYETVSPFLVTVPMTEDGEYVYDVDGSPKLELDKKPAPPDEPDEPDNPPDEPDMPPEEPDTPPDEPDTPPEEPDTPPEEPDTPPEEPKLPQTGLNNWPIPVLSVSGLFLVALGWYLHASGKKKSNEG